MRRRANPRVVNLTPADLLARETRFYVAKVRRMKDHYAALR